MNIDVLKTLIKGVSELLGNFYKLNPVNDHAVKVFWKILGGSVSVVFFYNLFMRDDLYSWIIRLLTKANPISFAVVLGVAMMVYTYFAQQRMIKATMQALDNKEHEHDEKHRKSIEHRLEVNPQVRLDILSSVCEIGAYRGMCAEFHNGKENAQGLGFTHFTENYEEINPKFPKKYVAESYKDMRTSFYSICDYVHKHDYIIGTTDKISEIDPRYAANMEADGIYYGAICEVKNVYDNKHPLGMLSLSWRVEDKDDIPSENEIIAVLGKCEDKIEKLLTFK